MNPNSHPKPPERITDMLEWVCPGYLFEGIIGDLEEQFYADLEEVGEKKARRNYWWNALRFFRPEILLRNKFKLKIINTIMLRNHFKIGIRNILRSKLYSFINAVGLSIGITFSILIYLFIQDENSFDQFHTNKERIFRIHSVSETYEPDNEDDRLSMFAWMQAGLAPTLKTELPEVQYSTGFSAGSDAIFTYGDKVLKESITYVHQDFFLMFDFKLLSGDKQQLLSDPSQIVLTQSSAKKYFEDDDPVGKDIQLTIQNETKTFTVAGIIEDAPANSSLDYKGGLLNIETRSDYKENIDRWQFWNTPTFIMLEDASQEAQLQASLDGIYNRFVQPKIDEWQEESGYEARGKSWYDFLNLTAIHLHPEIGWDRVSDPQYGLILSGIAILILLIACINYIALTMTSAAGKQLEVGIRKAVGGERRHLIGQFMVESQLLAVIAMLISIVLLIVFLPYFNDFTGKAITLAGNIWQVGLALVVFTVLLGLIAGSYPAFVLSGFKPLAMLKSRRSSKVNASVTKPLVVLQFAISAFLIICSVVMFQQMNYITTQDLGYNQEQMLVIPTYTGYSEEGDKLLERFKQVAINNPQVKTVSGSSASFNRGLNRNGYRIGDKIHMAYNYRVDADYVKTLDINIKEGRDFDQNIVSDRTRTLIVNEALVEDMGWEDPLNEKLNWQEDSTGGWKIIGVAENYHFQSLEQKVEPMYIYLDSNAGKITTILAKISPDNMPETIAYLQEQWHVIAGDKPFDYNFLDEDVARQYESYEKWSSIMWLSTLFAILIACLGLFGLAGINAVNRTKEIGIRKALGAELKDILVMMNRPFVIMAVISFILAAPASWWVMQQWLSDFEFAITLGWQLFAISLVAALFFALVTVTYHSVKAAFINPAETLKYE